MKISTKGDYGLRALVDLAGQYDAQVAVQVKDIARRQSVPEEYLGQLMVGLRRAGFVRSIRGASGGYLLARQPADITVAEVLETLEGSLALVDGLTEEPRDRGPGSSIRRLWWEATGAALSVLRATTVGDLAARDASRAITYHI
ncbi:MAG: Rrf2 family transcriptional regulator [Chloroflexi bacterium]|nr:Rrf2 family transcriptional regulator [Chloroflexota bacterium]